MIWSRFSFSENFKLHLRYVFLKAQTCMDGSNTVHAWNNMSSSSAFVCLPSSDCNERPSTSLGWFYCRRKFLRRHLEKRTGLWDTLQANVYDAEELQNSVQTLFNQVNDLQRERVQDRGELKINDTYLDFEKISYVHYPGLTRTGKFKCCNRYDKPVERKFIVKNTSRVSNFVLNFIIMATVYMTFIRLHALFDLSPRLTLQFVSSHLLFLANRSTHSDDMLLDPDWLEIYPMTVSFVCISIDLFLIASCRVFSSQMKPSKSPFERTSITPWLWHLTKGLGI